MSGLTSVLGSVEAVSEIPAPHIEYHLIAPILVVFGVAILGVLIEALAPRAMRLPLRLRRLPKIPIRR